MFFMCRRSVQKLEEDMKQLKAKQERTADRHLQDQVRQEDVFLRDSEGQ